jgi:hypothetical protein
MPTPPRPIGRAGDGILGNRGTCTPQDHPRQNHGDRSPRTDASATGCLHGLQYAITVGIAATSTTIFAVPYGSRVQPRGGLWLASQTENSFQHSDVHGRCHPPGAGFRVYASEAGFADAAAFAAPCPCPHGIRHRQDGRG